MKTVDNLKMKINKDTEAKELMKKSGTLLTDDEIGQINTYYCASCMSTFSVY